MGNGVSTEVKRKATKAIAAAKVMGALGREFIVIIVVAVALPR